MLLKKEREELVDYGKKLIKSGLTKGTGGNLSIYNRERNLVAISPSGMDYFKTKMEDIVILDLEGNIVEGKNKPSSEYQMHLIFYKNRKDIGALVHTHSVYSTVLATLREGLPASNYLLASAGPNIRCAEYASYGTEELGENALVAMEDRYGVFLANHGLIAGGYNLEEAFNIAEEIEHCAEIYVKARAIGSPVILPRREMESMMERFKTYGQK